MYQCYVDDQPCEVFAQFAHAVPSERASAAVGAVKDWLPCSMCRLAEAHTASLAGVRLGKHERRVLVATPGPEDRPLVIAPEADTRAADEALRRAIRKLGTAGLVSLHSESVETEAQLHKRIELIKVWGNPWGYETTRRATVRKRAVRLTPLGAALVDLARADLEARRPIRWPKYQAAALAATRRSPAELLEVFAHNARTAAEYHGFVAGTMSLMMAFRKRGPTGKAMEARSRRVEAAQAAQLVVQAIEAA